MQYEELPLVSGSRRFSGHLRLMQEDRMAFLERLRHDVDDIARLKSIGVQTLVVNHPDVLHEILVEKAHIFQKSFMTRFALHPLAGEGLFTSRGDLWRKQRKLMAPLFHPSPLKTYAPDMVQCTDRGLRSFQDGSIVELAKETTRITMSIAGKTLFGADTFSEADEIGEALTVALRWAANNAPSPLSVAHLLTRVTLLRLAARVVNPPPAAIRKVANALEAPLFLPGREGRRLRDAILRLDSQVAKMIADRRAEETPRTDLLGRLLDAHDDDGQPMSDKQVRDEVLTLFVAGHETTATALAWSIHCLCKHPTIYEAVQQEVDALEGDPTFEDLPRLALTLRVFKEATRLYPPVHLFARQCVEPTTLANHPLETGAVTLISPWILHRRRDLWPDPERFLPERFLPEAEAKRSRLAWLPFGAGPRTCIGNYFAMMEAQLVLATLLRRVHFEIPMGYPDEVPEPAATLRPRGGMPMRVRFRHVKATQN